MTRIQIIGNNPDYLETTQDIPVPITISVGDIRDISKRNGSFSKTITLPGTHNNNQVLGYYFDINVTNQTFNINKIQECAILQDEVVVLDNLILQLVSVKKRQNIVNEDDIIEYDVLIKDNVGDFYTRISPKYLEDLDFSDFNHEYNDTDIEGSFNNTCVDGYKYILTWIDDSTTQYDLQELKPAIYAKQYFDRIHSDAGYSYDWSTISDLNVQFDKLIIPYNGDDKKLSEEARNLAKVIVNQSSISPQDYSIVQGVFAVAGFNLPLALPDVVQDDLALWDAINSEYNNIYNLNTPNGLDVTYNFDLDVNLLSAVAAARTTIYASKWSVISKIYVNGNFHSTATLASVNLPQGYSLPGLTPTNILSNSNAITHTISNISAGDIITFQIGLDPISYFTGPGLPITPLQGVQFTPGATGPITPTITLNSMETSIALNSQTIEFNSPIFLNNFIPKKIKQTDFIKSICLMYNLFADEDPSNPTKIIYKSRDEYYDSGDIKDWTQKLSRADLQEVSFLPELTSKRVVLSYKEDKDPANTNYLDATKEIYGRQEVLFSSEFIKGIETKELVFSPTPMMPTSFGAIAPLFPGRSPNCNIRILIDNGEVSCNTYSIKYYSGLTNTLTTYPFVSHLDTEYNPTFDINFGVCDFYFYNIENFTSNNLYNINWRRTMAQLDQGKMLSALFYLNPVDIQTLKLNDKIRIDNSYWNINRIIDYNANSRSLTKVELLSIDDDLILPRFGRVSTFRPDWETDEVQDSVLLVKSTPKIQKALNEISMNRSVDSSIYNTSTPVINIGQNNIINSGGGLIIGNNLNIDAPGVYVGGVSITEDGGFSSLYYSEDPTISQAKIEVTDGVNTNTNEFDLTSTALTNTDGTNTTTINTLSAGSATIDILATDGTNTGQVNVYNSVVALSMNDFTTFSNNITLNSSITSPYGLEIYSLNPSTSEVGAINVDATVINVSVDDAIDTSTINITPSLIDILTSNATNTAQQTFSSNIELNVTDGTNTNFTQFNIGDTILSVTDGTDTSQVTINAQTITISPSINLSITSIPAFADDAAAGTAGLLINDVYQTDGTGAAPLNVAGVLMIKQ
jgi:hypothetical protein